MKNKLMKHGFLLILGLYCMTSSHAQSTPPLSVIAQDPVINMKPNSQQTIAYTIKNNVPSAPVKLNIDRLKTQLTPDSPLINWQITDDCTYQGMKHYVAPNGQCHVLVSITALNTTGQIQQKLAINYGPTFQIIDPLPSLSFNISNTPTATRTFTFENKCPYDVWLAFVGGGQLNGCTSDSDCDNKPNVIPGTFACDTAADAGKGICNWKNPTPPGNDYKIAKNGGTKQVTLIEKAYPLSATQHLVWSGVIGGRTNCTSSGCSTADCGGGDGACPVGKGLNQPAQQAEPTFQQESDFYDITGINGINIPMSIEPQGVTRDAVNPYTCGAPGITSDQASSGGTIGGCNWDFVPPSNAYVWVAGGSNNCSAHADCSTSSGEACGLSQASIANNSSQTTCGQFEGYWTADQVCGINSNYSQAPYFCNSPATNGTFTNMYQCSGTGYSQSCYNSAGSSTCCGCQNWQEPPTNITIPSDNSIVAQCNTTGNGSSNNDWLTHALPTLGWYKAACPPFYVYPFDDKSSTFSCTNNPGGINSTNYKITYCPGGKTGAPSGVTPNP